MRLTKIAEIPSFVEISESARKKVAQVMELSGLSNTVLLSGRRSYELAGKKIREKIRDSVLDVFFVETASMEEVRKLEFSMAYSDIDSVMGIGGGKVLDVGKVLASELNVPFISIPTVASHDGVASPVASFKEKNRPASLSVNPPAIILADLTILRKSPVRYLRAGFGDLISNITAIRDWELSRDKTGEAYSEVAASMAVMPASLMIKSASLDIQNLKTLEMLVRGLVLSGVSISIAGSSRPASGAEHKFSHALDYLGYGQGLHGEQVGIGAIIMEYLHQKYYGTGDWEAVKDALESVQAPTTAREIGITKEQVVEALLFARQIRKKRYTILEDINAGKDELELAVEKTGVA
ncbi:sn-glycerol-1-phosphate dehydrogenase [Geoglobus acetivorans]|uniref:Glycerol-1-phosphate dehydrogenase [NAD(P)+] n=1 Tax=Geoglobus acetivorans TaxID=565033 RepID=A0A0A7GJR5_GEOAI|nr:Glycerol-1-phosphate dehydrogenase [Geoglobus acetivorans]